MLDFLREARISSETKIEIFLYEDLVDDAIQATERYTSPPNSGSGHGRDYLDGLREKRQRKYKRTPLPRCFELAVEKLAH